MDGHTYKDGQTDHSGITIDLEPLPSIPTIGVMGFLLLLAGFSLFLFRKRSRSVVIPMCICLVAGLSFIAYAGYRATTVTNSDGEYDFADVEPGGYSIDASAPGYYPERIASFTVIDGANTAPDITLYPVETPTPGVTDTPTSSPTPTPTETPTQTPTETPTMAAGDLVAADPIVGNMRYVPAGTFTQGSPGTEPCRGSSETQFDHTLTRDLAVMETEVTRQMWADLLGEQPSLPGDPSHTGVSPSMAHPVQQNTWYESVLFANLLSLENGYTRCYYKDALFGTPVDATNYTTGPFYCDFDADGYRLATEGEWEYLCRAGTTTAFSCNETNYNGSNCYSCTLGTHPTLEQYCVYCAYDPGTTAPVGSKLSNPWNLKDVHGNVYEWCWDRYGTYPSGPETDYEGASSGSYRVIRGGGWGLNARKCRSAHRYDDSPDDRYSDLGVRLVRTLTPAEPPTPTPTPFTGSAGDLVSTEDFVGNMRYVPGGTFIQGAPLSEPCVNTDEDQFHHTLTRDIAVMEMELTRQMWSDLIAVQTDLLADPSDTGVSPSLNHPVQNCTWYEAVLYANLASLRNGLTRCYYLDAGFTAPIDSSNYTTGPFYCDFDANGYRLPSEGEWEYFCRAGTIGPFSCAETNYTSGNCTSCTSGTHTTLEQYCVYCANDTGGTETAGSKLQNPWNLDNVHGNLWEMCWDWYGAYPIHPETDYSGPDSGANRVHRGGGFNASAQGCSSGYRSYSDFTGNIHRGFRLVRTLTPAEPPTPTPTPYVGSPGDLAYVDDVVGNMRYVPGGTFTQGSPDGSGVDPAEPCRSSNETQFEHTLTRNIAVMETEVTRQMWADLFDIQPDLPVDPTDTNFGSGMTNPVQNNTWYEAVLYANLLSLSNGYTRCYYTDAGFTTPIDASNYTTGPFYCDFDADGYRLATEGEWEYLCRAGTTEAFSCNETNYNGSNCYSCTSGTHPTLEQYCVYCANDPGTTAVVGSKLANPWNLKDVHGNVYEWCWDWYGTYPSGPETDYEGAGSGSHRVIRGGGWGYYARYCRSAIRDHDSPGTIGYVLGVRLVRTLTPAAGSLHASDNIAGKHSLRARNRFIRIFAGITRYGSLPGHR